MSSTAYFSTQVDANEDEGLVLNWDKELKPDTLYITALEIGTGPDAADNIGLMPIELYRNATYVTSSVDSELLNTGDMLTLSIELAANTSDEAMTFDIQTRIPEGLSIENDSHMGTLDGQMLSWQVTQAANSEIQNIILVLNTAEQVMSKTLSFDVAHTVNSASLTETVGPVMLEGIPVALINGNSSVNVSAEEQTVVSLSATDSTAPNADDVLTYSWAHVSGPAITIDDTTAVDINVTLPDVDANSSAVVELTVSNGTKTATVATATIAITAKVVTPDPEPTSDSSGGAMGLSVLLLGLLGIRRRSQKSSS
ncbi:hypothetical protein [Shewanella sp. 10N.286.54.B9]|uniref:hypothetical protein n=1 Tax=Shewanella sp. 10N.286.54.B9 TaxID=3229719 RepID=UPI00354BE8D4